VITTTDAGGPLEFVDDGVTGLVCEQRPKRSAGALRVSPPIRGARSRSARLATNGRARSAGTASSIASWPRADRMTEAWRAAQTPIVIPAFNEVA